MPERFTVEQRTFLVTRYLETKNTEQVVTEFARRFPQRVPPNKATIHKVVRKFQQIGTVQDQYKGNSGRRRTARTPANINAVQNALQNNERMSCRRNQLGISSATVNRIIRLDLAYHPYRVHNRHELKNADFPRRLQFARWFENSCHNPRFLHNVVVGDEVAFGMNGHVSTQNVRCYAPKRNPPATANFEVSSDRQKLHLWGGICGNATLLGPYFFVNNVNGRTYLEMLNNQAFPQINRNYNINLLHQNNLWWVQDGATAHRTRPVRRRLQEVFDQRVIAMGHTVEWPARSPDLTPCDFFLWGYLKQRVYNSPIADLNDLRQRIVNEMNALRGDRRKLQNAMQGMRGRARKCIQNNGRHVEGKLINILS